MCINMATHVKRFLLLISVITSTDNFSDYLINCIVLTPVLCDIRHYIPANAHTPFIMAL